MRSSAILAAVLLLGCWCANAAWATTSRGEFIRKGDVLCAQVKRELVPLRVRAEAAKALPTNLKWTAAAEIWADQIRIQKRFVRRFHEIGLPANDHRARMLASGLDRGVVLAIRVQKAFAARNTAGIPGTLNAYVSFTLDLNKRTRAYGFRICGG